MIENADADKEEAAQAWAREQQRPAAIELNPLTHGNLRQADPATIEHNEIRRRLAWVIGNAAEKCGLERHSISSMPLQEILDYVLHRACRAQLDPVAYQVCYLLSQRRA
jgi:hypothetical protein